LRHTDRSAATASPSFALTTNVPAHNNHPIDTQPEHRTGDPCATQDERRCADLYAEPDS